MCDGDRDSCRAHTNVDGSEQPCWTDLTEAGSASLEKLHGPFGEGRYWIEGEAVCGEKRISFSFQVARLVSRCAPGYSAT